MLDTLKKVVTVEGISASDVPSFVVNSKQPLILKGFINQWPIVKKGHESEDALKDYLLKYANNLALTVGHGTPDINGRIFYNDEFTALNCKAYKMSLTELFKHIAQSKGNEKPPLYYMGTTSVDNYFSSLRNENDIHIEGKSPTMNFWMGNQSTIPAHYDVPHNIACNVYGNRRFTLFPPDQLENLYIGPLDFTPAGQSISLVDITKPDFKKYPKFQDALQHAQVAELEAGDALFLPSMWWHHVEGLSHLNLLATFWWSATDYATDESGNALLYAVMALRHLPEEKKRMWLNLFNHYIFDAQPLNHIPEHAKGMLNPQSETTLRNFKDYLIKRLRY
jgi:hypothetical protein